MIEDKEFLEKVSRGFDHNDIVSMSALNLAYIGDAVFEVMVRTAILKKNAMTPAALHNTAKAYVNAAAQSGMYHKLEEILTEEELSVMRRGRNAKSQTKAKNASVNDYRHATGMEALFGYLYMKNDISRLMEIFEICVNFRD